MTMIAVNLIGVEDGYSTLVEGLRLELGCRDVGAIAECIVAAEACDFHWAARVRERYLGQYFGVEEGGLELSRVAIMSIFGGRWHSGLCLVDGEGCAVDLLWLRSFEGPEEAETAWLGAH